MTFFLLKWVFNAIKRDSAEDDPTFKGASYVSKTDFIKQLGKNPEILRALGYDDPIYLRDSIKLANSAKDGFLTWSEFLDFFFAGEEQNLHDRDESEPWWNKLDRDGKALPPEKELTLTEDDEKDKKNNKGDPVSFGLLSPAAQREQADKKPVPMTESLKILQKSREDKTNQDVEDEFRKLEEEKMKREGKPMPKKKAKSKIPEYDSLAMMGEGDDDDEEGGGLFKREKSKNLLLQSQIEAMKVVFDKLDKYEEHILRRSEFIMALRTDTVVIDFIDCEAVQKAYSTKTLTLDNVFMEIERDEKYDQLPQSKKNDDINHKEFITWREFMNYFNDYREIEDRNRKGAGGAPTKKREGDGGKTDDEEDEGEQKVLTLIDQEKERRLKELPRLRPADQIDITEKQLQLLRNIFDSLPRVQTTQENRDAVQQLSFFTTIRKDPQIRTINSAIARDPEGHSRVPRETF